MLRPANMNLMATFFLLRRKKLKLSYRKKRTKKDGGEQIRMEPTFFRVKDEN